jgi:hypothetical protein
LQLIHQGDLYVAVRTEAALAKSRAHGPRDQLLVGDAGLFHSVYGTEGYQQAAIALLVVANKKGTKSGTDATPKPGLTKSTY